MPLQSIDHYTVNVSDLDASVKFYEEIIGLKNGARPNFNFPGAWLYLGDAPRVHLMAGRGNDTEKTGPFDHIAFRGVGVEETEEKLKKNNVEFRRNDIDDFKLTQLFVHDPDGVMIELNFYQED